MPVGWGCGGRGCGCRDGAAVLVVEHRSRRAVAARVAGCGGRAAASSSESDRGCGKRGRPSGCVVVSRRRCPTAHCVGPSGSAWPLRRVRARSNAEWRVWRTLETGCVPGRGTLETGCVGVQWCRECGGCHRVRGGARLRSIWSGNGGVCG